MITEFNKFLQEIKDKMEGLKLGINSKILDELRLNLSTSEFLLSSLEQTSESKFSYLIELKYKVSVSTDPKGDKVIKDEVETIKKEYQSMIETFKKLQTEYN